jgi:DNA modification methylase
MPPCDAMKVIERKLSELEPFEKNAKKHPNVQIKKIVRSIEEFGFTNPILTIEHDGKHLIIAGHARFKAAKEAGLQTVPTIDLGLPYEKAVAYGVADNKLAELAEWDETVLGLLLTNDIPKELLKTTGFNDREISALIDGLTDVQEDDFEDLDNIVPRCERGQLWTLGSHRLMCGDATSKEDVAKLMNGRKARMIFTDPPYNVGYSYDWRADLHKGKKVAHNFFSDEKSDVEYAAFITQIFQSGIEYTTEDASFYCWYATKHHAITEQAIKAAGWKISQIVIWMKNYPVLSLGQDFHRTYEVCFHGWKCEGKHFYQRHDFRDVLNWDDFQGLFDVWFERRDNLSEYRHPTQKPVRLAERAIKMNSQRKDIVLDFFGGSGSTLIACEQLDRQCFMMDIDPIYCEVIMQRWEEYTGKNAELIQDVRKNS